MLGRVEAQLLTHVGRLVRILHMSSTPRVVRHRAWARFGVALILVGAVALPAAAQSPPDRSPASAVAGSATSARFLDPGGDARGGLDVASVTVSNDATGKLTFVIEIPSHQTLPAGKYIGLYLDTDRSGGFEYLVWVDGTRRTTEFSRWDATRRTYVRVGTTLLTGKYASGRETIEFNRSLIGGVSSLNFVVITWPEGDTPDDLAPNTGKWTYVVTTPSKLLITSVTRKPDPPVAGESFTVSVTVERFGRPGRYNGRAQCDATIGGQRLRGSGSVAPGRAECRWTIPADAAGKTIRASIGVSEGGPTTTRKLSVKVSPPAVKFSVVAVTTSPKQPKAGAQFYFGLVVRMSLGSQDPRPISAATVTCKATIGGKALRTFNREVRLGYGGDRSNVALQCGWDVPHGTAQQTMIGSVVMVVPRSGSAPGATFRHSFTKRVR